MTDRKMFIEVMRGVLDLVGGEPAKAAEWLTKSNWAFDYKSAMTLIRDGRIDVVHNLLMEFESGTVA